jgi:hypothetical protein
MMCCVPTQAEPIFHHHRPGLACELGGLPFDGTGVGVARYVIDPTSAAPRSRSRWWMNTSAAASAWHCRLAAAAARGLATFHATVLSRPRDARADRALAAAMT